MEPPLATTVSVLLSSEYPIEVTACEEQVAASAARLKGEPTAAPLAGVLTVIPEEELVAELEPEVEPDAGVDVAGDIAACVALEAAPPQPVAIATNPADKKR